MLEDLSVQFYLILMTENVNVHEWLVAILLHITALGLPGQVQVSLKKGSPRTEHRAPDEMGSCHILPVQTWPCHQMACLALRIN